MYLLKLFRRNNRNCNWCNRKGFKMKKILSLLLCFVLCFCCVNTTNHVYASENQITPRLTYVSVVESSFFIDDNGNAIIGMSFLAYTALFSHANVSVTLEKRTLLLFWNEVQSWSFNTTNDAYINEIQKSVGSGKYRVQFEYTIYGKDGNSEVISQEVTAKK